MRLSLVTNPSPERAIPSMWGRLKKLFRRLLGRREAKHLKSGWEYHKAFLKSSFSRDAKVLDIGSGGDPFPHATLLLDRYIEPTCHRAALFDSANKPVVLGDIHQLPFKDKTFDYVFCSHVLEHVTNPITASMEIQRIGSSGYIETPTFMKDCLFSWAKGMHKWYVCGKGNSLVFFEYSERQLEGLNTRYFRDLYFSPWRNEFQGIFNQNQDIFNNVFEWRGGFNVFVFFEDGLVDSFQGSELSYI